MRTVFYHSCCIIKVECVVFVINKVQNHSRVFALIWEVLSKLSKSVVKISFSDQRNKIIEYSTCVETRSKLSTLKDFQNDISTFRIRWIHVGLTRKLAANWFQFWEASIQILSNLSIGMRAWYYIAEYDIW